MAHRRKIKGVLHNFLSTYTSRYSDYEGYWVFGLIVETIDKLRIDLLCPNISTAQNAPMVAAVQLAAKKFKEQIDKEKFEISSIQKAQLIITRSPIPRSDVQIGQTTSARTGYDVRFAVRAEFDDGKAYENELSIFVAPHDQKIELRSARAK